MGAAPRQRKDVVDFLCRGHPAFLLALLTQRMRRNVSVAYPFPRSAVPTAYSRVTVVLLVAAGFLFLMLLTEPSIREIRAAWVGAGSLRSFRHSFTSFGHLPLLQSLLREKNKPSYEEKASRKKQGLL